MRGNKEKPIKEGQLYEGSYISYICYWGLFFVQ